MPGKVMSTAQSPRSYVVHTSSGQLICSYVIPAAQDDGQSCESQPTRMMTRTQTGTPPARYCIMQIVRGGKVSRLHDLLVIRGKLSRLYSNSKHLIIKQKKFAGKPLRLEANPRKPRKFSTTDDLHYTVFLKRGDVVTMTPRTHVIERLYTVVYINNMLSSIYHLCHLFHLLYLLC